MNRLLLNEEFLPYLEKTTRYATKSIDISTFKAEICDKPRGRFLSRYFVLLTEKAEEGLQIRLLINYKDDKHSTAKTNFRVMQELKNSGVDVRYLKNNRCCHAKIVVIDRVICFVGSHNLSVRSCHNNFELSVFISETSLIDGIAGIFESTFLNAYQY